jgi:three-Cys-motif partner protein
MDLTTFFEEATTRSLAKAKLVADYFRLWSAAMLSTGATQALAYVEFCAGPGRYEDGSASTPLLVLQHALDWEPLAERLVTVFNDIESEYVATLREEVERLPGIENLRFPPIYYNEPLDLPLVDRLSYLTGMPILAFADPWGFKMFDGELFGRLLRQWSAELLFFFNFNRVNMALGDATHEAVLAGLFGAGLLARLRAEMRYLDPDARERAVLGSLAARLGQLGAPFVLPFRICQLDGNRTSYYIVHATRSSLGHALMRRVMAANSTSGNTYEYATGGVKLLPIGLDEPVGASPVRRTA